MTEFSRRQYMAGVAALAGVRWENEDIDPDDADPLEGGVYTTGEFTPKRMLSSGEGDVTKWILEDDDFTDRTVEVFYDNLDVLLALDGNGEGDLRAGALGVLTPEQARQVGAALYQAGEELERRQEVTDGDQ